MPLWGPIILVVVGIVGALVDDRRARRSLKAWAAAQRYELVEYHRASPWDAPYMYLRGSRSITWRVTVRGPRAQLHSGLVSFVFSFLSARNPQPVEVTWNERPPLS